MNITLSQFAGFCDGVRRAYEMVDSIDFSKTKTPVYILGSLVHNPDVIKKVKEKGIEKISYDDFINSKEGDIGTLIITAHGVGPEVYKIAKSKKIKIIDTTCPKVVKVQRLARVFSKRGHKIILVGDKGHKEVEGINSWGEKKAKIISSENDLGDFNFSSEEKIIVLAQTTQDVDFFKKTSAFVKKKNPNSQIFSTICYTTHNRQEEIKKLAQKNDMVIIIGSTESANSNRLFEISKSKNSKTYFIENSKNLDERWFFGKENVLVSAGASTPNWIIQEVIEKIKSFKK